MDCGLSYWSEAVSSLPDHEMRFLYSTAIDTLTTNTNLALWYNGQVSAQCGCCFPTQTQEALRQRRFDIRHVLSLIYNFIFSHIKESCVLVDLLEQAYCFPVHIAATDEQSDIVIWTDHQCTLVELTLLSLLRTTMQTLNVGRDCYADLLRLCTRNGHRAQLITIQVGSRGVLDLPSLSRFKQMCKPTVKVWTSFVLGKVSYLMVFCNLVQLEHQISTVHYTNLCCTSV